MPFSQCHEATIFLDFHGITLSINQSVAKSSTKSFLRCSYGPFCMPGRYLDGASKSGEVLELNKSTTPVIIGSTVAVT